MWHSSGTQWHPAGTFPAAVSRRAGPRPVASTRRSQTAQANLKRQRTRACLQMSGQLLTNGTRTGPNVPYLTGPGGGLSNRLAGAQRPWGSQLATLPHTKGGFPAPQEVRRGPLFAKDLRQAFILTTLPDCHFSPRFHRGVSPAADARSRSAPYGAEMVVTAWSPSRRAALAVA